MESVVGAFLLGVGLSAVTVFADALIKHASQHRSSWALVAGAVIYGLTAVGWYFVMGRLRLSTVGAVYAITCVVLLTLTSIVWFREQLSAFEALALVLAICSIGILFRFA